MGTAQVFGISIDLEECLLNADDTFDDTALVGTTRDAGELPVSISIAAKRLL